MYEVKRANSEREEMRDIPDRVCGARVLGIGGVYGSQYIAYVHSVKNYRNDKIKTKIVHCGRNFQFKT